MALSCEYTCNTISPNLIRTELNFMASNHELVKVQVTDEKDKSLGEAIRITKIIESRLNKVTNHGHFYFSF